MPFWRQIRSFSENTKWILFTGCYHRYLGKQPVAMSMSSTDSGPRSGLVRPRSATCRVEETNQLEVHQGALQTNLCQTPGVAWKRAPQRTEDRNHACHPRWETFPLSDYGQLHFAKYFKFIVVTTYCREVTTKRPFNEAEGSRPQAK